MNKIKKCLICGEMKPIVAKGMCRKCYDHKQKPEYYLNNKEKILKQRKDHYAKNRRKILGKVKSYTKNNPEKVFKRRKKHRERNKERLSRENLQWRIKNKEWISNYMKKYRLTKSGRAVELRKRGKREGDEFGDIILMPNVFGDEIPVEGHHLLNDLVTESAKRWFVWYMPTSTHNYVAGPTKNKEHWIFNGKMIKKLFCMNIGNLLKGEDELYVDFETENGEHLDELED